MNLLKFSQNLKIAMLSKNITQKKLADYLGTTQQTISRWLKGINQPDLETLLEICLLLDETPNELLGYDEIDKSIKNTRIAINNNNNTNINFNNNKF